MSSFACELVAQFLLERIAEDEDFASRTESYPVWWSPEELELDAGVKAGDAQFISLWSPERIRADCKLRRALVDWADDVALRIMLDGYLEHPEYEAAVGRWLDGDFGADAPLT